MSPCSIGGSEPVKFILIKHEGHEHLATVSSYADEAGNDQEEIETVASFCHGHEWEFIKAITTLLNKYGSELDE